MDIRDKAYAKAEADFKDKPSVEAWQILQCIRHLVSISDVNAAAVLRENTDIGTFVDRLHNIAGSLHSNKYDKAEIAAAIVKDIIGGADTDIMQYTAALASPLAMLADLPHSDNCVCLPSEVVIPLLHAYLGIGMQEAQEQPRQRFRRVSLDD